MNTMNRSRIKSPTRLEIHLPVVFGDVLHRDAIRGLGFEQSQPQGHISRVIRALLQDLFDRRQRVEIVLGGQTRDRGDDDALVARLQRAQEQSVGTWIVAKNGILMLDTVEEHLAAGDDLHAALVRSGHRRFRPVLMTSLAAMLGMLPLALAIGSGAELLQPLAIAVIGGLAFALMLSLVVTPTVYAMIRRG